MLFRSITIIALIGYASASGQIPNLGLLGSLPNIADVEEGGSFTNTFGNPLLGLFGGLGQSLALAGEKINLGAAGVIPNWFIGIGKSAASQTQQLAEQGVSTIESAISYAAPVVTNALGLRGENVFPAKGS